MGKSTQLNMLSKTITLTDAQIKSLPSTPIELIAAPGVGKAIVANVCLQLGGAYMTIDWHGDYTNVSPNAVFQFSIGNIAYTNYGHTTNDLINFLAWGEASPAWILGNGNVYGYGVNYNSVSDWDNQPLLFSVQANTGDFTGGNPLNTLSVTIFYSIVSV